MHIGRSREGFRCRLAGIARTANGRKEIVEELPRAAISCAITKGWIHKAAGEAWFRVTRRAAAELQLPTRHNGAKIHFIDASKLPKSLPAFDEPKPTPKPVVSDERAAAILAALREPRNVLAQAASGQLSLPEAYELFRVPAAHRAELFAALQAGKSRNTARKLAGQLLKSAN